MSLGDNFYVLDFQVKDLERRLSEAMDAKAALEDGLKSSEHFTRSLETELQSTKAALEAGQTELREVQDKVKTHCSLKRQGVEYLSP